MENYLSYVGIFSPSGEPISPHLLCCGPFAVVNHSFMNRASHLQPPRLVNNPGWSSGSAQGLTPSLRNVKTRLHNVLNESKQGSDKPDSGPDDNDSGDIQPESEFNHLRKTDHSRAVDNGVRRSCNRKHEGKAAA
jgi:hypothetical protein